MDRRINIFVLFIAIALLFSQITLDLTGWPSGSSPATTSASGISASGGSAHGAAFSRSSGSISFETGTPELIRGHIYNTRSSLRSQTRGSESQRSLLRILILLVSILCLLKIAIRYLKHREFLPEEAVARSVILAYIHSEDGKK